MPQKPVRVFLIRKNIALAAGALLAAVAIFCAVNVPAAITAAGNARQLPIYCVDRSGEDGKKYCAISFDAAWGDGKVRQSRGQTVFVQLGGAVGIQAGYVAGGDGAAELLLQGVDLGGAFLQHVGGAVADGHQGHIGVHGEDIQRLSFRRAAGGEG